VIVVQVERRASVLNVLLVDDCPGFLRRVRSSLQDGKRNIYMATTPRDARSLVATRSVDVAIVDFFMREHRGIDLILELREIAPALAAAIYTGLDVDEPRMRARALGIAWFIKDTVPRDVLRLVEHGHLDDTEQSTPEPTFEAAKRQFFKKLVAQHDGNVTAASAATAHSRSTIQRYIRPLWLSSSGVERTE
jgi:DNA-binding NtrC family response regulator